MAILPFRKVNYATKLWQGKCDVPWWVYIETAFPVLLHGFYRFGVFGQSELLKAKLGRSPSRWSRRLFRDWNRITPKYNFRGRAFLFKLITRASFLGHIWLITDILMDGYYRFTTLIHTAGNCTPDPGGGTLQRSRDSELAFIANTGWGAVSVPILEQNSDNWLVSQVNANLPPGQYIAVFGMTVRQNPSSTKSIDFQCGFRLRNGPFIVATYTSDGTITPGPEPEDIVARAEFTVPPGAIYNLVWAQHGSENDELFLTQADVMVSAVSEIEVIT